MLWLVALVAFFIGTSIIESNTVVGLGLMAPLAGMLLMRFLPRPKPAPYVRPNRLGQVRQEAQQAIAQAERRAAKRVASAERRADRDGQARLAAARDYLASEGMWV